MNTNDITDKLDSITNTAKYAAQENTLKSESLEAEQKSKLINQLVAFPVQAINQYEKIKEHNLLQDYETRVNNVYQASHSSMFPMSDQELSQGIEKVKNKLLQEYNVQNPSAFVLSSIDRVNNNAIDKHLIERNKVMGQKTLSDIKNLHYNIGKNILNKNDASIKEEIQNFTPNVTALLGKNNADILALNTRSFANDKLVENLPNSLTLGFDSPINKERQNLQKDFNNTVLDAPIAGLTSSTNLQLNLDAMIKENPAYAYIINKYRTQTDQQIQNSINSIAKDNPNSIEPSLAERFIRQRSDLLTKNVLDYAEATNTMHVQNIFTSSPNSISEQFEQSLHNSSNLLNQYGTTNILDSTNINALKQSPLEIQYTTLASLKTEYQNYIHLHPNSGLTMPMLDRDINQVNPKLNAFLNVASVDTRFSLSNYQQIQNVKEIAPNQLNAMTKAVEVDPTIKNILLHANPSLKDSVNLMVGHSIMDGNMSFPAKNYYQIVNKSYLIPTKIIERMNQQGISTKQLNNFILNSFVLPKDRSNVKVVNTDLHNYRLIYNNGSNYTTTKGIPIEFEINNMIDLIKKPKV